MKENLIKKLTRKQLEKIFYKKEKQKFTGAKQTLLDYVKNLTYLELKGGFDD